VLDLCRYNERGKASGDQRVEEPIGWQLCVFSFLSFLLDDSNLLHSAHVAVVGDGQHLPWQS